MKARQVGARLQAMRLKWHRLPADDSAAGSRSDLAIACKQAPAWIIACILAVLPVRADELFDRVEDALTFSTPNAQVRARLSGTLDLEGYSVQLPAPGVIYAEREELWTPRLSLFLDAQLGPRAYAFAQARADRGFDPQDEGAGRVRLDEYALRFTPSRRGHFNVQIGQFATVVGNWTERHLSWANPFITAPMPYEHLTGIWDNEPIRGSRLLLQWSHVQPGLPAAVAAAEKTLRLPIVWGPSYAMGAAVAGDVGKFRYAVEMKLGALSSRPEAWRHGREQREHPTVSARLGYRPSQMWDFGVSASTGPYLRALAAASLRPGESRGDFRETVIAHDVAFAWHHWQVWGEVYAARFDIPNVAHADTLAYYVETKYKLTPQLFGALRWNQQLFDTIPERGRFVRWGFDAWRIDVAPGYRFTPHTQLKLQYSLLKGDHATRDFTRTLAAQLTVRF